MTRQKFPNVIWRVSKRFFPVAGILLVTFIGLMSLGPNSEATRSPAPLFASCTWDKSNGNWNDSFRWSCGSVPGPGDTAVITEGTVTITSDVMVSGIQLSNSTLTCNANLTVTGASNWISGTINGNASSKLTNSGSFTISGSSQKSLGVAVDNSGTISWLNGQLVLSQTLTNLATGTVDFQSTEPFTFGTLINAGKLTKSTASNLLFLQTSINNSGTINVDGGTLDLANESFVTNTGANDVAAGATLILGNCALGQSGSVSGQGTLEFTRNCDALGSFNVNNVKVSAGLTNLNTDVNFTTLNLSGGTLAGTGAFTVLSTMSWTGGTLGGSSSLAIPFGATLNITGTNPKTLTGRSIINSGTISYLSGQWIVSSTITNQPAAALDFQSSGPLSAASGTLINAGTLKKSTSSTLVISEVSLNNSGVIQVDAGVLDISGNVSGGATSNNSGFYNVAVGATLGFGVGTHTFNANSTVNNSGVVHIFGNVTFGGSYNLNGTVDIENGSTTINSNVNINTLNFRGGTLLGTGSVAITNAMNWSLGTILRPGNTALQGTGMMDLTGTGFKFLESTFVNNGTANYLGGHFQINTGGLLANAGTFNLKTDSPVDGSGAIQNTGAFVKTGGNASVVQPDFSNAGTLEITSTTLSFGLASPFQTINQNSGITRLNSATLIANLNIIAGQLIGTGTVEGNVTNAGIIAPGLSLAPAGSITISRNYTQTANGSLVIELGGNNPGVDSDLLITNTAASTTTNLAGTLNVSLVGGFYPPANTSFQVARYATHNGSFTVTSGLDMGGGLLLDADYRNMELVLVGGSGGKAVPWVQVVAGVPELRGDNHTQFDFGYTVQVGNSGGETTNVVVVVEIEPDVKEFPIESDDIEGLISNDPLVPVDNPDEFAQIPKKFVTEDGTVLIPFVMQLPPASRFELPGKFHSTCPSGTPVPPQSGEPNRGKPKAKVFGHAISLPSAECIEDLLKFALGFLPAKDCIDRMLLFILKQSLPLEFGHPINVSSFLASAFLVAANCALKSIPAVAIALKIYSYLSKGKAALKALSSCLGSIFPDPESPEFSNHDETACVTSRDPNDKIGPDGVGANRYISGAESLRYAVYFENVPTATAPAQVVQITDQLDPSLLNFNTFALGNISFVDKTIVPPPHSHTYTTDVDMRPKKNIIVRVNANLDTTTGVLTWLFTSLDPASGLPLPPTSTEGFLDPDLIPPQGQGAVTFSVTPRTGLPSGTVVKNKAKVVFDQNPPLDTPEWFNTIDNNKPMSSVQPLGQFQCSSFPVHWSGTDATSDVAQYSVFVSKDGAPYEPWLLHTTKTTDYFNGVTGSTYSFFSVARDGAGNVENSPTQPDATTTVNTTISVSPGGKSFTSQGGTGSISVMGGGCTWIAESSSPFITITNGASGSGDGFVTFSVAANTTNEDRDGEILVAGHHFVVDQSATGAQIPATIQFDASTYLVDENHNLNAVVVRSGDTSGPVSVAFSTSSSADTQACNVINGAASSRCDYESGFSNIRFGAGEVSKVVTVLLIDDAYLEGPETFSLNLANPVGATLGSNSSATVTIIDNEIVDGVNPLDNAESFVRLHYLDFLNREPDAAGMGFWTNQITSCGQDQICAEVKRINVSAAFYLSIEFQETGYLIERIYKTAYGDGSGTSMWGGTHSISVPIARLNEFLSDTQQISLGVIVLQPGWEQVLENNKVAFTNEFVARSRFITAHPLSLTSAQFVDQLNANVDGALSQQERDQLVNELAGGLKTRAQVLRAVAEDSDLKASEFNKAFVLMQYFGYLRRNPNDPQDSDYTGYDFWLSKLNQFNGNFINAEMVKAFILSGEYRQRVGK